MSHMEIVRLHSPGAHSAARTDTFTGTVWMDPVLPVVDGVMANMVFFAPGARTYWHQHERGQLLQATAGSGLVCSAGGPVVRLNPGDLVWVPPGEPHWHGGSDDSYLVHLAVSLGTTTWAQPVTDEEYAQEPESPPYRPR